MSSPFVSSRIQFWFECLARLLFVAAWGLAAAVPVIAGIDYGTQIRPLLRAYCTHCHGEEEKLAGEIDLR